MPLYEYRCRKCGKNREKIQKFSDPPLTTCENCGGRLERLVSRSAIRFKGSGWYVTDYARKSSETKAPQTESPSANKDKKTTEPAKPVKSQETKPTSDKERNSGKT